MSANNKESISQILKVSIGVCLVCSLFVSSSVIALKPLQEQNKILEKKANVVFAAGLSDSLQLKPDEINLLFNKLEVKIVDLDKGKEVDPEQYQTIKAKLDSKDKDIFVKLPTEEDIAGILEKPRYAYVYSLKENDKIKTLVLSVYGKGLWSTMYGFISLGEDLTTVKKFLFYEHGETPGLGGEVDNPNWRKIWIGKKIYDENDNLKIEVIKSHVDPTSPNAQYQVDGLSGATLTTKGVNNLIRFWMSDKGYRPFLLNLKKGKI